MKALQAIECRETLFGVVEGEKFTVYCVPVERDFLCWPVLCTALDVRIVPRVRGARRLHICLGDDESREAEREIVEPAPNRRLLSREQASTEVLVVALASFEAPVDKDVKLCGFRR